MTGCGCTASSGCRSRPERQKRSRQDAGAVGAVPWRAHPAHRAPHDDKAQRVDFYQRPPCGGRPRKGGKVLWKNFYPRPPCGGRPDAMLTMEVRLFLSTSPLRGTTCGTGCSSKSFDFYPRPPCGGRPLAGRIHTATHKFLSTSPLRGTTQIANRLGISIHVPLAGDDQRFRDSSRVNGISIHVPLAGDDRVIAFHAALSAISIHVPLAGDDSTSSATAFSSLQFLSTSPLRGTTDAYFLLGGR